VQQQNAQPRHRQFGRVRAAGEFTYCDQTSAEEVRSPAFRSARPLSHGACARCACRSGWSARMRARALYGPGPGLALAPAAPLDTRHHERPWARRRWGPWPAPFRWPWDSWPAPAA